MFYKFTVGERRGSISIKMSNLKNSNPSLESGDGSRRSSKHVVIKTDPIRDSPRGSITSFSDLTRPRPSTLFLLKEGRSAKQLRNRSKSIDASQKVPKLNTNDVKTTSLDKLHKLKEKLLHSSPDLNDNSDTESTPLVSETVSPTITPALSPEFRKVSTIQFGHHSWHQFKYILPTCTTYILFFRVECNNNMSKLSSL